ncbi:Ferric reductase transmembrane component 3 [Trichoderma ghanense]|uniref:Ferric reductase transmembrane component 3 n=1 Tax=Trichoderma ghanense TaxID=65468 RepID=A0ABY2GW21_9HYPO
MIATRYMLRISLLLVGLFSSHALSSTISVDQECVSAVFSILGGLNFVGIGYGNYYVASCQNPLKVASIYAISKTYCPPSDLDPGFDYLKTLCRKYGGAELLPEEDVAANLTDEAVNGFPVLDQADTRVMTNLTTPVLISRDWFDLGFKTEDEWDFEARNRERYGFAMYGFWGGVLLVGTLHRLAAHFLESRQLPLPTGPEDTGSADSREKSRAGTKSLAYLYSQVRKRLTTPSVFPPYHRQLLFGCTIPTRIELFVVASYWVVSFVLCCVNYRAFEGNLYWPKVAPQIWRYIADRAGVMAYSNLPLIWMFSGRNNIFIWLTGWQFSTFNLFHRHIARIATLQAIMHSIGYTAFYYTAGYGEELRTDFHQPWLYLGVAATISMSVIVFFSFSWFRRKIYESFLLIHIVLSVVVIVALFYHTSIFDGQYDPYLWPLVAIWSFDRFLRIVRVVYCNLRVRLRKTRLQRSTAAIAYDQDANIITVQINTHVKPGPGQHYYLYQPFRLKGWENHPFTLAHWSSHPGGQAGSTDVLSRIVDGSAVTSIEAGSPHGAVEGENLLSFWIRPYDGWTRHLRDVCLKAQTKSQLPAIHRETVLLEGPYGTAEPLWAYDEVLLMAGGSGIATMVPYILDHIARTAAPNKLRRTRIRGLTLVWSNRSQAFIKQIAQRELAATLARDDIECMFYCTNTAKESLDSLPLPPKDEKSAAEECKGMAESSVLKSKEETDVSEAPDGATASIRMGRPDIAGIVEKAAASASESGSRLAVLACGPSEMADAARAATYRAMRQSHSVEYFEEAFGW